MNQEGLPRMNTNSSRWNWIFLAVLLVAGGGCSSMETMRETMQERVSSVPPTVRTVEGNRRQVYEAAFRAMTRLGYQFTSGGPAQGRLEGLSRIGSSGDLQSSRQRTIAVHLEDLDGGKVEVQVKMTEIVEEDFGRATASPTEAPLRDPVAYEAFFEELNRQLSGAAPDQGQR